MESFPKKKSRSQNDYEKFDRYVETEIQKGKTMSDICLEICKMRFKGSRIPFYDHYRYLSDSHRGYRPNGYKPTKTGRIMDERPELLPIKTLASVVFSYMSGKKLDDENGKLMKLLQRADWFNQMYEATCSFCCLIKGNDSMNLIRWMKKYWKTNITQLKTFIRGIKLDYKAVKNTIIHNVTNGITEGFVNKLKVVKRIMYGKASIELLKNKLTMEHLLFN